MIEQLRTWLIHVSWVFCLIGMPVHASILGDLVRSGDLAGVASALDDGAAIDEKIDGMTALYIACEEGRLDLAELLISRGADVNLPVKFQRTPLYAANKGGYADVVKLLLDSGANPNQLTKSQTPLHFAAEIGCLQCAMHLVAAGAEVNALTPNGSPPIHLAKRNSHEDVVAYLQGHGAGAPPSAPISGRLASANVETGKQVFDDNCVLCHVAAPGVEIERANLWGIVGRPKASESQVQYSTVLKDVGGTWTIEELNSFISNPTLSLPGTDMIFLGLPDEQQRADLIAYLRTLSNAPVPLP